MTRRGSRIQTGGGGGFVHSEGGVSYRNFRSGSKLLQGPGQINKQKKIADRRRGGGSDHPQKKPVSAPDDCLFIISEYYMQCSPHPPTLENLISICGSCIVLPVLGSLRESLRIMRHNVLFVSCQSVMNLNIWIHLYVFVCESKGRL